MVRGPIDCSLQPHVHSGMLCLDLVLPRLSISPICPAIQIIVSRKKERFATGIVQIALFGI